MDCGRLAHMQGNATENLGSVLAAAVNRYFLLSDHGVGEVCCVTPAASTHDTWG